MTDDELIDEAQRLGVSTLMEIEHRCISQNARDLADEMRAFACDQGVALEDVKVSGRIDYGYERGDEEAYLEASVMIDAAKRRRKGDLEWLAQRVHEAKRGAESKAANERAEYERLKAKFERSKR